MDQKYHKVNSDIRKIRNAVARPWLPRAVLALSGVLVLLLHVPLVVMPLGRDQGIWVTAGMALSQGKAFYTDFLHFHFPGLAMAYQGALLFTDDARVATVLVSAVGSLALVVGIYLLLKETVSRGAGAWGALLFAVQWPTSLGYWDISQKDFLTAPGVLFAVWLAARSGAGRRFRRQSLFFSGVMVGLACLFKPVVAIAGPMIALGLLVRFLALRRTDNNQISRQFRWTSLLTDLALLLAGGVLVGLGFVGYLAAHGALHDAWVSIFGVAYKYGGSNNTGFGAMLKGLLNFTMLPGEGNYNIGTILLLTGCIAMVVQPKPGRRLWLLVPLVTAALSFIIQRKGFPYHAIPWQVALFPIAATGIAWAWRDHTENDAKPWGAFFFAAALFLTIFVGLLFGQSVITGTYGSVKVPVWLGSIPRNEYLLSNFAMHGDYPNPRISEALAESIRQQTKPEDTILVWGLECQLYALSGRLYATNTPFDYLLTSDAVTKSAPRWQEQKRQEFMSMLRAQKPVFIIVVTNDATRVEPVPSDQAIKLVPGFQEFIDDDYVLEKTVERFKVYRLKT